VSSHIWIGKTRAARSPNQAEDHTIADRAKGSVKGPGLCDIQEFGNPMSTSDLVSNDRSYPLITIAIPTFNRASLLKECVRSALSQTYRHFEVLVSDNASTDETREILGQFSDGRLRVIGQETNIGLLPNWNACLAEARGDYVIFLSDDDRIAPWLLERCVGVIGRQAQVPIVVTLSNLRVASVEKTWPAHTSSSLKTGICDGTEILVEYLTNQISVSMCSIMLRTALLRARGGIPLDLPHTADVAAWAPLLLLGKAGFVNEACATYYDHDNSETARLGIEQLLCDGWKVAALISYVANQQISDLPQRRTIQLQIRRGFARRGLMALSYYRHIGGSLQEILSCVWRFRDELSHVDMTAALRFGATICCPRPIAERIRRLKQTVPDQLAS
jgi:glycosyltransferase involved in cell wall biosynthesis